MQESLRKTDKEITIKMDSLGRNDSVGMTKKELKKKIDVSHVTR